MKRILVLFGTRPEVIKLAPVIKELRSRPAEFETIACSTGQHREMLDQAMDVFQMKADLDNHFLSVLPQILLSLRSFMRRP